MNNLYNDKRWRRKREVILKRDEYKYQVCMSHNVTTPAEHVHHITPLKTRPDLWLDMLSLCSSCHNQMHDRSNDTLSKDGIRLMRAYQLKGSGIVKVKIVYGAPCSGKSTYVRERAGRNDLIFDYDKLI